MKKMKDMLSRINELARKAKSPKGLTEDEKIEQKKLRQQYIKEFRGSLNDILLHSTVLDPEGTDVTPEKLRRAQIKMQIDDAQEIFENPSVPFLKPQNTEQADQKEE